MAGVADARDGSVPVEFRDHVAAFQTAAQHPAIKVEYSDVCCTLQLPMDAQSRVRTIFPGVFVDAWHRVTGASRRQPKYDLPVLDHVSGALEPGTMTLLLAPPGHGKSALLKALSQRMSGALAKHTSGSITYNGRTAAELQAEGARVTKLVSYVESRDNHYAQLTVKETLEFAARTMRASVTGAPLTEEECQREVGIIMRLLGLEECAHTIVGNDSVRGCSGGQKKRVTIAEALITNPRVLLMDEISTGLDSAITYDILNALRWWSHTTRGTILVSLLQPTPETVALFSHLMLLRDGGTCYHGPMAAAPAYFASIGWLPPLAGEGEGDFADWCVSLLTKPDDMVAHQRHRIHHLRRHLPSVPTASARGESAASDTPVSATWDEDTDSSDEESGAGGSNDAATLHVTDALNSVAKRSAPLSPPSADSSVPVAATDVAVSLSCFSCDATPSDAGLPSQTVVRFCETQPVRDDADGPRGMPSPKFAAPVTSTTAGASSATSQAAGLELLESVLTVLAAGGGPPTTSAGFHAAWQQHRCTHAPAAAATAAAVLALGAGSDAEQSLGDGAVLTASSSTATHGVWQPDAFALRQYGDAYVAPPSTQFRLLVGRQRRLLLRDSIFMYTRVIGCVVMGLILGSLFYQVGVAEFNLKLGVALFAIIHLSFSSFAEIPPAIETRAVAYKHFAWKGYSPTSYMLAYVVVSLPIAILETLGFCAILYFMSGLAPDAGRFFFFTLILCLIDVAMATCFRMVAYMSARLDLAQALTGPIISIQVIFAGYLITFKKIPAWLIWLYWSSPFAWALRAVARSEATSGPYQRLMPDGRTTLGEAALQFFEIQTESKYQWGAIGVIIAFFCVCCVLTAILLDKVRFDDSIGTRRPVHAAIPSQVAFVVDAVSVALVYPHTRATSVASGTASPTTAPALASARGVRDEEDGVLPAPSTTGIRTGVAGVGSAVSSTDTSGVDSRQSAGGTAMGALPFSPVTLTFSHVRYSVVVTPLPGEVAEQPSPHVWRRLRKPSRNRTLLHNVHGYALPGTLTFLMGASGAGKTTLLDCLAGRKTSGSLTGSILFNGVPMNANTLRRCAYVEQQDMHMPYATVREALLFSATLRLPADTPTPVRDAFVDQVLHLLELHTVQDRLIGYSDVDGLAAGQRKRLTIGVELCSNAPLIFLDEPTTGLDSRAAAVVMRVVRNIAATGRTVVSTIHQPSEEVFLQADNLLLLQSGGWQVYMGALGRRGSAVVDFLQRASPGTPRKPRKLNPASWMLDVLMNQLWPPAALKAGASLAPLPTASRAHEAMRAIEMVPVSVVTAQVAPGHGGNACTITPASPHVGPEERTTTDADTRDAVTALVADGCTDVYALAYAGSGLAAQNIRALAAANETFKAPDVSVVHMQQPVYARSFGVQLSTLLQRLWLSYNRDKPKNLTRFVALLGLALTFGTIYYRVTDADGAGVQSKIAVIFLSVAFCGVMNYNTGLPSSPNLGVIVHRERSSRMYHASANTIASLLIEIPWTAAASLMFTAITYFMVGLRSDAAVFFHYYFILFLVSLIFNYVAQCLVSVTPNVAVAQAVAGLIMSLWFLFGGLFAPAPQIPRGWKWLYVSDPVSYGLEAVVTPQFYCAQSGIPGACPSVTMNTELGPVAIETFAYIESYFGIRYAKRWWNTLWLSLFIGSLAIITLVTSRYITWVRR